jgi:hypothetical protein
MATDTAISAKNQRKKPIPEGSIKPSAEAKIAKPDKSVGTDGSTEKISKGTKRKQDDLSIDAVEVELEGLFDGKKKKKKEKEKLVEVENAGNGPAASGGIETKKAEKGSKSTQKTLEGAVVLESIQKGKSEKAKQASKVREGKEASRRSNDAPKGTTSTYAVKVKPKKNKEALEKQDKPPTTASNSRKAKPPAVTEAHAPAEEEDEISEWGGLQSAEEEDQNLHLHGFSTDSDDSSDEEEMDEGATLPMEISRLPTIANDDATVRKKLEKARKIPVSRFYIYLVVIQTHSNLWDRMRIEGWCI